MYKFVFVVVENVKYCIEYNDKIPGKMFALYASRTAKDAYNIIIPQVVPPSRNRVINSQ